MFLYLEIGHKFMGKFNALNEFALIKHILASGGMNMRVNTHKQESEILGLSMWRNVCG
jgi:hypothetical protein